MRNHHGEHKVKKRPRWEGSHLFVDITPLLWISTWVHSVQHPSCLYFSGEFTSIVLWANASASTHAHFSNSPVFWGIKVLYFDMTNQQKLYENKRRPHLMGSSFQSEFRRLGTLPSAGLHMECLKFLCLLIIGFSRLFHCSVGLMKLAF